MACLDIGLAGCASLPYASYTLQDNKAVISLAAFEDEAFVLLKVDGLPAPLFVSESEENGYTAILLKCTHRGCQVQPAGEILECPCHGSRYTHAGQVIRGPAPDNLADFPVEVNADVIRISLS